MSPLKKFLGWWTAHQNTVLGKKKKGFLQVEENKLMFITPFKTSGIAMLTFHMH